MILTTIVTQHPDGSIQCQPCRKTSRRCQRTISAKGKVSMTAWINHEASVSEEWIIRVARKLWSHEFGDTPQGGKTLRPDYTAAHARFWRGSKETRSAIQKDAAAFRCYENPFVRAKYQRGAP